MSLDELLYLQGDEDCDVSVQCRGCDKGGEPVIFYSQFGSSPYDEARVPLVRTVDELFKRMYRHLREVHDRPSARDVGVHLVAAIGAYVEGGGR